MNTQKPSERIEQVYKNLKNEQPIFTNFTSEYLTFLQVQAMQIYLDEQWEKKVKYEKYLEEKQMREESKS